MVWEGEEEVKEMRDPGEGGISVRLINESDRGNW